VTGDSDGHEAGETGAPSLGTWIAVLTLWIAVIPSSVIVGEWARTSTVASMSTPGGITFVPPHGFAPTQSPPTELLNLLEVAKSLALTSANNARLLVGSGVGEGPTQLTHEARINVHLTAVPQVLALGQTAFGLVDRGTVKVEGTTVPVTIIAIPLASRTVYVVCAWRRHAVAGSGSTCEETAATVKLPSSMEGEAVEVRVLSLYRKRFTNLIASYVKMRAAFRRELDRAASPVAMAKVAGKLEILASRTASGVGELPHDPVAALAQQTLWRLLRAEARAYTQLEKALSTGTGTEYHRACEAIGRDETSIHEAADAILAT